MTFWWRSLAFVGLSTLAGASGAATPQVLGAIDLPAPVFSAKASQDGRRLVVQLGGREGRVPGLQLLERVDGGGYELRDFIALEGNGPLALSPDGRKALLHVQRESGQFNKAIAHVIFELDLARPAQVVRRELTARRVVLAPDASAYAASEASGVPGKWRMRVNWPGASRAPVVVDESDYFFPVLLSTGGRFVLFSAGGRLEIRDLQGERPVKYEQAYTGSQRYGCFAALLEDGTVVVEDARIPRLGFYAAAAEVPRIGVLQHGGGEHCAFVEATGSSRLVVRSRAGALQVLDVRDARRPRRTSDWSLPASTLPLAVAGDVLVALGAPTQLQLLRLEAGPPPAVAWSELEAAYRATMATYREEITAKKPVPFIGAVSRLERSGLAAVIDFPVTGISPQRAAAMFNDYGFLLGRIHGRDEAAERALKRAIALDPKRMVAYLNLADLQRKMLSSRADWKSKTALSAEIRANYRSYLALGGKSTISVTEFLRGDPAGARAGDVCGAIAAYANAGRLGELMSGAANNVPMGERRIDMIFTTEGTSHSPAMYAFDSATDKPLGETEHPALPPHAERLWGGDHLGLLVYRDKAHILHYRDFAHPVGSASLSGGDTCEFASEVTETVGPAAVEPELCANLKASGEGVERLKFDGPVWMTRRDVAQRWTETGIGGTRMIDFANDGSPANVAELGLASGAGAGCDETFFDLVDRNATRFEGGERRDLLMQLQGANPSNRYPILPCRNSPSFFSYRGRIYFENKPANWPPVDAWNQYHRVTRVERGRVVDVCDFRFRTRTAPKR